jgi:hypothetical protein
MHENQSLSRWAMLIKIHRNGLFKCFIGFHLAPIACRGTLLAPENANNVIMARFDGLSGALAIMSDDINNDRAALEEAVSA